MSRLSSWEHVLKEIVLTPFHGWRVVSPVINHLHVCTHAYSSQSSHHQVTIKHFHIFLSTTADIPGEANANGARYVFLFFCFALPRRWQRLPAVGADGDKNGGKLFVIYPRAVSILISVLTSLQASYRTRSRPPSMTASAARPLPPPSQFPQGPTTPR